MSVCPHLFPCADIRYYQDLSTEKDVKRYLEKDLLFGHMLKKVFEPERFAGRPMLARWDGVWYAVRGQEVVVPARRVVIQYVETGETEEMSYREFCKVREWRPRRRRRNNGVLFFQPGCAAAWAQFGAFR